MSAEKHTGAHTHTNTHTLHAHLHPHAVEPHMKQWVVSGAVWRVPLSPVL